MIRDISNAPKDRTIMIWTPDYGWQVGWWNPGSLSRKPGWEWHAYALSQYYQPTHWTELPPKPAQSPR